MAALLLSALGLFVATNIDDLIMLSLFFARGAGQRGAARRIVVGQYLGFSAVLALAVAAALGVELYLPPAAVPFFGLIPLGMGLWAIWTWWRGRHHDEEVHVGDRRVGVWGVAAVSFAHGGNNIGLYVPVFLNVDHATVLAYCLIFLVLDGLLLWLAKLTADRPAVARVIDRWDHVIYPAVLIGVGLLILAGA